MLHEKRNVLRLSRTIMEDHQIIMPRSQQQQTTTLTLSLMLIRLKRMKMDTYSKSTRQGIRPEANISRVVDPVSTTQASHLFKRLSCSRMAPWLTETKTHLKCLQEVNSLCILKAHACLDKASNHTKSRLINSITI